jgi:predicted metalloprotease
MKWRRRKGRSPDVIDLRGRGGGRGAGAGGLPIPGGMAAGGGTIGLIIVVLVVVLQMCGGASGSLSPGAQSQDPIPPGQDPQADLKDFSVYVFEDAQQTWAGIFKADGRKYSNAQLVLYTGSVTTEGCGSATSAVGPFYCPADDRIYIDLSFFSDMEQQLGAPGDFAWAYVISHEMAHHVQDLQGTSEGVDTNQESVRLELQADCYAGIWGATVFEEGALEEGDLEEAFTAAEAVGDDRLQQKAGGEIDPDSFTHGTSEQRREWFTEGYESGDPDSCDTFSAEEL